MPLFEKKQIWILVVGALVCAGVAVFGYIPIAWQKHVITQTLKRQAVTMEQVQQCSAQLQTLQQKTDQLEPLAQRFDRCVPDNRQFAALWQQIAELMTRHNLRDQQVKPGTEMQNGIIHSVALDIQCNGSLKDIFDFVSALEKMDRLVRIEQMDLANDKDYSGQLTMTAKAQVFYRTQKEDSAGSII
ncbi:MAG TPA: type 4a pilus biogenesis protein PilO [Anaerohalosphaeraceae bacterium]|nr:type 4a pilus biogenesis protein PilO [Anaerohalosphaeraceae bacterium]